MRQRLESAGLADCRKQRAHIDARRGQQRFAHRHIWREGGRVLPVEPALFDQLAHQRIAVGMNARGGKPQQHVTFFQRGRRQQRAAFGSPYGKPRKIVIPRCIHARHFRRLAADQRAIGDAATLGNAFDHLGGGLDIERAGGEIVEKEQRLGALNHEIVDAHGNEVDAHGIVFFSVDGDLQLCAHAVIGGNQNRVGKACRLEVEQSAKPADLAIGTGTQRRFDRRLDTRDQLIAGIDVDTGLRVGHALPVVSVGSFFGRTAAHGPYCPLKA